MVRVLNRKDGRDAERLHLLKINHLCKDASDLHVAKKWPAREIGTDIALMHSGYPKRSKSIATGTRQRKSMRAKA
jgi:hypothetical protein